MPEAERLEAVKFAVSLGTDVNARANFGDYPMEGDVAYTLLYYPHNIDKLLDLGVGDPRWNGSTPLIGAIMSNQPSIVQYLVDQGADVRAKTTLGWTPLNVAEGRLLLQRETLNPGLFWSVSASSYAVSNTARISPRPAVPHTGGRSPRPECESAQPRCP